MMEILKSASKVVFIAVAVASIVGMFLNKLSAEQFMVLASMTFTFYFANKGDNAQPYAGK